MIQDCHSESKLTVLGQKLSLIYYRGTVFWQHTFTSAYVLKWFAGSDANIRTKNKVSKWRNITSQWTILNTSISSVSLLCFSWDFHESFSLSKFRNMSREGGQLWMLAQNSAIISKNPEHRMHILLLSTPLTNKDLIDTWSACEYL